ncbi:MAG TPA: hypothetical protein DEB24_08025 [Coriobacteriia bacterium]|nr:hypothetical protein [Coriobacteriia bacterium]
MTKNYAFIDAQNLRLAIVTADHPWTVDLKRLRVYLRNKYRIEEAYYFLGAYDRAHEALYTDIQRYGFILIFREHGVNLKGGKKGNVDVDIVFQVMKVLCEEDDFGKVVLISGDGDYKRMVDYLISKGRFSKLLIPCKKFGSSLYRALGSEYFDYIDRPDMRRKIGMRPKK